MTAAQTKKPQPAQSGAAAEPTPADTSAVERAISVLDNNRIMAISTLRPDGWPQTTIVGYANVGLLVYFMIFRTSQKFSNLKRDNRVSMAIGQEPARLDQARAVFAGAEANEVNDTDERKEVWTVLQARHPNLFGYDLPDSSEAVIVCARCKHVSVADYTKGMGHTDAFTAEA
jgi:nitroimidazol reductase NimA-like FMN-containing flavoprotein (pyridoxamine 5'-phosphate oxidase superfamily)